MSSMAPPSIDFEGALHGFSLRAVIDWIEVDVALSKPSQHRHVRDRMAGTFGNTYAHPLEGEQSSRTFRIRVQNPTSSAQFMRDIQCMSLPGQPPITESDVSVVAIEIALDAHQADAGNASLAKATAFFLNRLVHLPAGAKVITRQDHRRSIATRGDLLAALAEGCSVNLGEPGADHRVRAYVKNYDTQGDTAYMQLPQSEHRARLEVTLRGDQMPFKTVAEWRAFRFEGLGSEFFAMCRPEEREGLLGLLLQRQVFLGRAPDAPKVRPSDRRKRPLATRRDTATNERIRDALRGLTRRHACQNSGDESAAATPFPEESGGTGQASPKYLTTNHTPTPEAHHPEAHPVDSSLLPGDQSGLTSEEGFSAPVSQDVHQAGFRSAGDETGKSGSITSSHSLQSPGQSVPGRATGFVNILIGKFLAAYRWLAGKITLSVNFYILWLIWRDNFPNRKFYDHTHFLSSSTRPSGTGRTQATQAHAAPACTRRRSWRALHRGSGSWQAHCPL